MMAMNGFPVARLVRRSGFFTFSLFVLAALMCSLSARADSNQLILINATVGPITTFQGSGIKIGQIEPSLPTNHVDILGNLVYTTNSPSVAASASYPGINHATAVASVMVSTNLTFPGVAPGASLYAAQAIGTADDIAQLYLLATQMNVQVINQSFSTRSNFAAGPTVLGTSVWERALDTFVATTGVLVVQTPGNDGPGNTHQPAGAYNILVVGAASNSPPGTAVADFSPGGYLSNGRSSLDIIAPGTDVAMAQIGTNSYNAVGGTNVFNVIAGPLTNHNNLYSGTSFAAPLTAGTVARLLQAGATNFAGSPATVAAAQDPRTTKAILLNSATKLAYWQQGTGASALTGYLTGAVTQVTQPLDANQGAGLLNANGAYLQLAAGRQGPTFTNNNLAANGTVGLTGWDFNSVKLSLTNVYRLTTQASGTVALTLDWYRDVGPTVSGTNSVLGMANLNLNLYTSSDVLYTNVPLIAQSISGVDNVEHLWFTNLPAAYYQVGVGYAGYNSQGGPTPTLEPYSVAWSFVAVPEPSTLLLAGLGVTTLWWGVKRRRRRT